MRVTLKTDYGYCYMDNMKDIWIRKRFFGGYVLMFQDNIYRQKAIYTSNDIDLLKEIGLKILDGITNGKSIIDIS